MEAQEYLFTKNAFALTNIITLIFNDFYFSRNNFII